MPATSLPPPSQFPRDPRSQARWYTQLLAFVKAINLNEAAPVADLGQTISASPTQAEVQAISDKIDELLAALRAAGIVKAS